MKAVKLFFIILVGLICYFIFVTKNNHKVSLNQLPTLKLLKWGAYTSWDVKSVNDFESQIGRQMDIVATFVHWGNENELPLDLGNLTKKRNKILLLYWEAMDYNNDDPNDSRFSYDSILSGKWDSYITDFANQTKNFGGEIILIPFEEMNGDWYPWSIDKNNNSFSKHIAAYKYLRKFFVGITNVKFGWAVNNESVLISNLKISDYYPGDKYVDIIGVNGFNFDSPWLTFSQIFDKSLIELESIDKPIMIFSTSCAPGPNKATWITDAFATQIEKHPKIIGWIWFNENKEKDWRVSSDLNSLSAFKSILPRLD